MKNAPDITATLNFHCEGPLACAALASLADLVNVARATDLSIETQAILDRADEATRDIVSAHGQWIDHVEEVSFGDLGLTRNQATRLARGRFLAFLDGDDLWGEQWLSAAFAAATASATSEKMIWHPEHLYLFDDSDFGRPHEGTTRSFHSPHAASNTPGFNPMLLVFFSLWSSNAFAAREIFLQFPYRARDVSRGIGFEDWSWNLDTLGAGIHHGVVPGTVHLLRRKQSGSLERQSTADGLMARLPPSLVWGLKWP
jgi:hypothetical protein